MAKAVRRAHVVVLAVRGARCSGRQGRDVPRNGLRNTCGLHAIHRLPNHFARSQHQDALIRGAWRRGDEPVSSHCVRARPVEAPCTNRKCGLRLSFPHDDWYSAHGCATLSGCPGGTQQGGAPGCTPGRACRRAGRRSGGAGTAPHSAWPPPPGSAGRAGAPPPATHWHTLLKQSASTCCMLPTGGTERASSWAVLAYRGTECGPNARAALLSRRVEA